MGGCVVRRLFPDFTFDKEGVGFKKERFKRMDVQMIPTVRGFTSSVSAEWTSAGRIIQQRQEIASVSGKIASVSGETASAGEIHKSRRASNTSAYVT